jgi:hypothetical protein
VSQVTEQTKRFGTGRGHDLFQDFTRVFSWTYTVKTHKTSAVIDDPGRNLNQVPPKHGERGSVVG